MTEKHDSMREISQAIRRIATQCRKRSMPFEHALEELAADIESVLDRAIREEEEGEKPPTTVSAEPQASPVPAPAIEPASVAPAPVADTTPPPADAGTVSATVQ